MLTREEAQLIAGAINVLRADWSVPSIMAILGDDRLRHRRTYRQVVVAFAALASDPECRKPTRIFEHGPWWVAAHPLAPVISMYRRPTGLDCSICSLPEEACRARRGGHEFDPRPPEPVAPPADLITPPTPAPTEGEI